MIGYITFPQVPLTSPQNWGYIGGMKKQKIKTQYPNVRYYEHTTRKLKNGQADRYFSIRYQDGKRTVEEGMGWASEGWNAQKASKILVTIKENKKTGVGPQSLAEMRTKAATERAMVEQEKADEQTSNMLLQEFFVQYHLPHIKRNKRTWLLDERRFNKVIKPTLGSKPIRSITQEDIQEVLDSLADTGASASTVKHYKSILSHMFTLASKTKLCGNFVLCGNSPMNNIKTPPVKNARERFLTAKEAELLISAAKELPSPDIHDCIVLSLNTGLRLGELQRLDWLDVDMTNAMLTVRDEAFRKPGGKVPLNSTAMEIFKVRQGNAQNSLVGQVFPPLFGSGLRGNLSHAFKALVDSLGLNDGISPEDRSHRLVFHTLRHTFASWLAIAGTDIYRIQKLMRHKTITMTMRYAHLIPDATRDAVHNLSPPKDL